MSYILILNASHIVQSLWRQRQVKLRKRYIEVNFMIKHILVTSRVVEYFLGSRLSLSRANKTGNVRKT